jgi:hypothetical protein
MIRHANNAVPRLSRWQPMISSARQAWRTLAAQRSADAAWRLLADLPGNGFRRRTEEELESTPEATQRVVRGEQRQQYSKVMRTRNSDTRFFQ